MAVLVIREHKRFAVCRKARVGRSGKSGAAGLLIELSVSGCRLSSLGDRQFTIDETLEVRIAGAEPLIGQVRWTRDGTIGLRFARPLSFAGLDHLIRLCRDERRDDQPRAYGT